MNIPCPSDVLPHEISSPNDPRWESDTRDWDELTREEVTARLDQMSHAELRGEFVDLLDAWVSAKRMAARAGAKATGVLA